MRILAALAIVASLGACTTSTSVTETADEIRITQGLGGLVPHTGRAYNALIAKNKRMIIDGQVISADAFYAFATPGVCYTENAVFSPHSASYFGIIPARKLTGQLADILPPPLRDWFRNHHSFYDPIGFPSLGYDKLTEIWPEGACRQDTRT